MERETATIEGLEQVQVDYTHEELPPKARKLKPHVYKGNAEYCCLFGPDPQVGIFGCGETPEEAIAEWEKALDMRITQLAADDHLAKEAINTIGATNEA